MRLFIFLVFCVLGLAEVHAGDDRALTERKQLHRTPVAGHDRVLPQPEISRDSKVDTQEKRRETVKKKKVVATHPIFSGTSDRCVRPGDILSFHGKHLSALSNSSLAINLHGDLLALKRLSLSDSQFISQLPDNPNLQANHTYPVYLLSQNKPLDIKQTELTISICSFVAENSDPSLSPDYEPGEILIFADAPLANTIRQKAIKSGYSILQNHMLEGLDKTMLIIGVKDYLIQNVIAKLRLSFPAAVIDFNHHYQPNASPRTYAANSIDWPDIKACNVADYSDFSIGIIDGYVDQTHPALIDQRIIVKNFLKNTEQSDKKHGTAIAVILTGNKPDSGFQGLLPGTKIMAASILRKENKKLISTTSNIVRSINWLLVHGVRLVNVSLSGTKANLVLESAFNHGIKRGLVIFAAAGNNGPTASESFPAALPGVIAITAVDAARRIYRQANHGKYIDFAAPGVDIWSVDNGMQGKYTSGTSFAVPHALAVAALYLLKNESLSQQIIYAAMQEKAYDLGAKERDNVFGWGLVKAERHLCQ